MHAEEHESALEMLEKVAQLYDSPGDEYAAQGYAASTGPSAKEVLGALASAMDTAGTAPYRR